MIRVKLKVKIKRGYDNMGISSCTCFVHVSRQGLYVFDWFGYWV